MLQNAGPQMTASSVSVIETSRIYTLLCYVAYGTLSTYTQNCNFVMLFCMSVKYDLSF